MKFVLFERNRLFINSKKLLGTLFWPKICLSGSEIAINLFFSHLNPDFRISEFYVIRVIRNHFCPWYTLINPIYISTGQLTNKTLAIFITTIVYGLGAKHPNNLAIIFKLENAGEIGYIINIFVYIGRVILIILITQFSAFYL